MVDLVVVPRDRLFIPWLTWVQLHETDHSQHDTMMHSLHALGHCLRENGTCKVLIGYCFA